MQRVAVIGNSGAGKSTLASFLAERLDAKHIELDGLYHQPNWTTLERESFRARVRELVQAERWVVDGNYSSSTRDLVWAAADTIVWVDLPRRIIFPRLLKRTLGRMWNRTELWNGNRERWSNLFDPRPNENVLLWMLTQHGRKRRQNVRELAALEYSNLTLHRLRTPSEVQTFADRHGTPRHQS